jgi:hypothetical protein
LGGYPLCVIYRTESAEGCASMRGYRRPIWLFNFPAVLGPKLNTTMRILELARAVIKGDGG